MKFFKGKIVKWLAGSVVTVVLISLNVPAPVATTAGNAAGEFAAEMVD
ncbi:hypothetical protein [Marinomonas transparens]|uniref:Uncharacterized protein n=1 Tax=Marinomonas transparens TaxID=2795388 RepID=A0A934N7N5_9GAMM|nr:hypothetical protein [Marinomonas transparens]MBJ7539246.1 hypothetical protein [Marinomonas transparens]